MAEPIQVPIGIELAKRVLAAGEKKTSLSAIKAFLLGCVAGVFIGMGGMFMLLVRADIELPFALMQILGGLAFCLGLFLVVTAGAELFTGNNLMIIGVLEKHYRFSAVIKSWIIVWFGNLTGSLLLVLLLWLADFASMDGGAVGNVMVAVAASKIALSPGVIFFRGIMCNILVCLAVWMGFAVGSVADKLAAVLLPICAFVACGFEHCVANMFLLPMGWVAQIAGYSTIDTSTITLSGIGLNLLMATIGNLIGGAVLVGTVYWFTYLHQSKRKEVV